MPVSDPDISRLRLIRDAGILEAARREIALRRGRHNANHELGRALKTEFVLQYMSEPQLRAKVRRGLLKVEQFHAMARGTVYCRQRGRISAREVYDQVNACSYLPLILAGIATGRPGRSHGLAWKNVILYGEIKIDPAKAQAARALACISVRIWSVP